MAEVVGAGVAGSETRSGSALELDASSLTGDIILTLFGAGADGKLSAVALAVLGGGVVSLSSANADQLDCQKDRL